MHKGNETNWGSLKLTVIVVLAYASARAYAFFIRFCFQNGLLTFDVTGFYTEEPERLEKRYRFLLL